MLAHLGSPTTARREDGAVVEGYGSLRLDVRYVGGLVQAVTTRSAADVAANGVRVGISASQLLRLVPKLTCVGTAAVVNCVAGRAQRSGDQPTTFVVLGGQVAAIRVERLRADIGAAPGT